MNIKNPMNRTIVVITLLGIIIINSMFLALNLIVISGKGLVLLSWWEFSWIAIVWDALTIVWCSGWIISEVIDQTRRG